MGSKPLYTVRQSFGGSIIQPSDQVDHETYGLTKRRRLLGGRLSERYDETETPEVEIDFSPPSGDPPPPPPGGGLLTGKTVFTDEELARFQRDLDNLHRFQKELEDYQNFLKWIEIVRGFEQVSSDDSGKKLPDFSADPLSPLDRMLKEHNDHLMDAPPDAPSTLGERSQAEIFADNLRMAEYMWWQERIRQRVVKGDSGGAVTVFRRPNPCAELKDSKALSDSPGGPGEYPGGEVAFWLSMLDSVPIELKNKIRAWLGAKNRAAILRTRDGRSLQELSKLFGWDTMPEFFDKLVDDILNLFDAFEETTRVAFDQWVLSQMIDMAVNESLTGVPFSGSTDPIKWIQEVAKKTEDGKLWEWVQDQITDNVKEMMFRDIFANLYQSLLAYVREAKGKRSKYGDKYRINPETGKPYTEEEYLEALMHDMWNAEGNLDQAKDALNDLEETTYLDMVGSWMDWFRKNDPNYNKKDPHGKLPPYRDGCKEQDDAARNKIKQRLNKAKGKLMGWNLGDTPGKGGLLGGWGGRTGGSIIFGGSSV